MDKEAAIKFYQKNKVIIFPVLVGLASLILIVLVIYPQITSLLKDNNSLGQVVNKSKFLEVKAQELQKIDGARLQNDVEVTLNTLPDNRDYLVVMGILQDLLSQAGFNLGSLRFTQAETNLIKQPSFGAKMEISGPKVGLSQFLTSIENSYRPMRIAGIESSSPQGNSSSINAIITVSVFYAPLPATLGSVDAPLPEISDQERQLVSTLAKFVSPATTGATSLGGATGGKSDPFN